MQYIICHYAEIGIKGRNRKNFEERLVENIKFGLRKTAPDSFESVRRISGGILIKLKQAGLSPEVTETLKNTFSLAYFAYATKTPQKIDSIKKTAAEVLQDGKFDTFKIDARRSQKTFLKSSQEVNELVGEHIVTKLKKNVKLNNPDITCFIEIVENAAFVYTEKISGPGGLPVGVSAKTLVMLSGGIDSPVAAYYAMKRGSQVSYIHFHSLPYTSPASVDKTGELVEILTKFQPQRTKLYLVPFYPIQKEIMLKTPAKYRVILYRRFMFRIAEEIAKKEKALALVTGESLGQVASQTLENIATIENGLKIPVLRPLIGFDKQEIVNKAREICTYETSILPHEDCCSLFIPKSPATKTRIEEIQKMEQKLAVQTLVRQAVEKTSDSKKTSFKTSF